MRAFNPFVLIVSLFLLPQSYSYADVVISTFEESGLANNLSSENAFEGLANTQSSFRSGNVTFQNDGVFFGGTSWSGFGYSRRTTVPAGQEFYNNSNDLISKPAVGAAAVSGPGSSATWGVVGTGGVMTADAGYRFDSLNLTSTLYTWSLIANGGPFIGPAFSNGGGTGRFAGQDDFFTVRFQNTATQAILDFSLADYRGATDYVYDTWQPFNLAPLNASEVSISFLGSRETKFGDFYFADTPEYVALDNIAVMSAVPEPGSVALVGLGGAMGLWYRRRRRLGNDSAG